ncbi:tetratricopeptide repeat protein [Bradymonas sediminis]|uniref:Uncharacterized protein n=1 Tax=Bradymonas sediminis TaxID=1548548 RepID=A0A2Z4FL49_9DELT|nr:hypothetical protein [Bradymonas sediminis]AWV89622.1 hypothetical protein DN745_09835 [Bradymonas sediminis]
MSDSFKSSRSNERAAEIRAMVEADFERISQTRDPYGVMNLAPNCDIQLVRERFERYERFYRVENFRRFDDPELTVRAQEIRSALSRAMVAINGRENAMVDARRASQNLPGFVVPAHDDDCVHLGDIYFRDGLTYLRLGDLNAAEDCLHRAVDHDPTRGILLAYLHYARYKLRNNDPLVVEACEENLRRAASMEPDNVEVFIILMRFGLNIEDPEFALEALTRIEALSPEHPKLSKLRERFARLKARPA